ncbi:MAG: flagellar motor protein MotA [Proteobacteria bacterium]|nr:flagellar motor protein MotA [Pseudomonadota bacterium]
MSFGTLIGFLGGIILFVGSIMLATDNLILFLSAPSFIMVVGGTLANAYICYQAVYVNKALVEALKIFNHPKIDQNVLIEDINKSLEWADIAFKQGPTGLEDHLKNEPDDHLLSFGIDVVLRQYESKEIRELMTNTIESEFQRSSVEVEVLDNMSANAPAFGMIGTLVGLVIMLDNLGPDPEKIGGALAVALLTTLYGVIAARLVFQPASKKMYQRASIERFRNYLMMEIFIMIAENRSASYVRDRIRSFLRPSVLQRIHNPREKVESEETS